MKWIIGIIVVVLIGAGLWWSGWLNNLFGTTIPQPEATTTPQQPVPQSDLPSSSSDASDSALLQDSAAVDTQLQALSSDSGSIDESMNDKAVEQDY